MITCSMTSNSSSRVAISTASHVQVGPFYLTFFVLDVYNISPTHVVMPAFSQRSLGVRMHIGGVVQSF
jgi:hypothetical protein